MNIYSCLKKILFKIDPEKTHLMTMDLLARYPFFFSQLFSSVKDLKKYKTELKSMSWNFPVGLAAGLDKNAEAISFFSKMCLGAIEVGTVTPKAQEGNEKPRMFRYPEVESLRNSMGFNNIGANRIYENILNSDRGNCSLGVNLGKIN